jgi:hypothetical protein
MQPSQYPKAYIKGAGGYGVVVATEPNPIRVWKHLYNPHAYSECVNEAQIMFQVQEIKKKIPEIHIPTLYQYDFDTVLLQEKPHMRGLDMEFIPPPHGFKEQVHMLLGYKGDDTDEEWGVKMAEPVGPENWTRGFFASPETLEMIWKEEGSEMTIERLAFIMGKTYRALLEINVLPIDLEWVWSNGKPTLLDFGLCEFAPMLPLDPYAFLRKKGLRGLADDFYIPHEGNRGYEEFMKGFETLVID